MRVLTLANEKGGVGKSMIATQFAYYCADKLGLKTLFIDLDHQANSTKAITSSEMCVVSRVTTSDILIDGKTIPEREPFLLVAADNRLTTLERQPNNHNKFANNLSRAIKDADDYYDICIIDTNPNPDIRQITALVVSTHLLSPLQLNQEAIDGIGRLYKNVQRIRKINPELNFLGLLPNLVEPTPFQKKNMAEISEQYGSLFFRLREKVACMPKRTALAEAQAAAVPVWKLPKTSAKTAWTELSAVFGAIVASMNMEV